MMMMPVSRKLISSKETTSGNNGIFTSTRMKIDEIRHSNNKYDESAE